MTVPNDDGQEVVEITRDTARQASQRLHLLGLSQPLLGLTMGALNLRPVHHRDTPAPPCYTPHLMPTERTQVPDEPPPFLGTWRRVYAAVLIYLASLILLFYEFTRMFS